MDSKKLHVVAFVLLVVGGINWLLIGLLEMNVVMALFGGMPMLERGVYILVGLSAVYELITHRSRCMHCARQSAAPLSTPPAV